MITYLNSRLRPALWRRLLIGVAATVLYAAVTVILTATTPAAAWPAIGDADYSNAQATAVPALNIFALGTLLLAALTPLLTAPGRFVLSAVAAIAAVLAGPVLAGGTDPITPGTLLLAAAGVAIGLAHSWSTVRLASAPTAR